MIRIILLLCITSAAFAQQKPKETPPKPEYEKFVKLSPRDVQNFFEALQQWKRLAVYDPTSTPEAQVQTYKSVEAYALELGRRLKLDSALIKPDSVVTPKKKK